METSDILPAQPTQSDQNAESTIISAWNTNVDENQQPQHEQQQSAESEDRPRNPPQQRRVCGECRRRKVGCDKKQPCHHCRKSGVDCVYPPDGKSAGRLAFADDQIWDQLRRLEPMFKTLVNSMEHGTLLSSLPSSNSNATHAPSQDPKDTSQSQPEPLAPTPPHSVGSGRGQRASDNGADHAQPEVQQVLTPLGHHPVSQEMGDVIGNDDNAASPLVDEEPIESNSTQAWSPYGATTGKLVKDGGREMYVGGTFWEALHTEYEMGEDALTDDESDQEGQGLSSASDSLSQYALMFNSCFEPSDQGPSHLPRPHRLRAWKLFKNNVHPVATILHLPSVEPVLLDAAQTMQNVTPPVEALLFVVYFGAVNSLSEEECLAQFGSDQSTLLARLRRGIDYALARSNLMDTDNILTIQTFVLYLVLLRSYDPKSSWNLTGLAARLAQSLGMHRDGSMLNLSPFDAEMRRRIWWNICILDTPASEDNSCSPSLMELSSFDARPPLNVEDSELYPSMKEYPTESTGITDMSFTAARCWASEMWRTMIDVRRTHSDTGKSFKSMTTSEKEAWIDKQRAQITSRFSGSKGSHEPLHYLITTFIGTIIGNLRILVLNPLGPETSLTADQRRRVFQDAMACMTHSYQLRTDPRLSPWVWLTRSYNEWHAFAVVLSGLCDQPLARDANKAWRVVEQSAVLRWDSSTNSRRGHQWRSVMRSIEKARRRRRKEIGRRKSSTAHTGFFASDQRMSHQTNHAGLATFMPEDMSHSQVTSCSTYPMNGSAEMGRSTQMSMYRTAGNVGPLMRTDDAGSSSNNDVQMFFNPEFLTISQMESLLADE